MDLACDGKDSWRDQQYRWTNELREKAVARFGESHREEAESESGPHQADEEHDRSRFEDLLSRCGPDQRSSRQANCNR